MNGRISRPTENRGIILPRIGFIKTGEKSEKGFPRSLDYFIAAGKYAKYFTQAYGEKPNMIQIVFFDDDPAISCNEKYEYRDGDGRLFAYGDGEVFQVWNGTKYVEMSTAQTPDLMKKVEEKCKSQKGWAVTLTMSFIIPKVRGIAGHWQYLTKGALSTIPQIRDTFDTMLQQNGFVKGVIFDLSVDFAKSQKPGVTSRYPVVQLVPNASDNNQKIINESFLHIDQPKQLNQ